MEKNVSKQVMTVNDSKQDTINGLVCTQKWQSHDNKGKKIKGRGNEIEKCSISKWAAETAVITVFSRMSGIQMEAGGVVQQQRLK